LACFRWPFFLPAIFSRRVRFAPLKNLATPSFPCGIFVLGVGCALLSTPSAESVSSKVLAILALGAPRNCSCTQTQARVSELSRVTTKHKTTLLSRQRACSIQHHPCSAEPPPEESLVSLIRIINLSPSPHPEVQGAHLPAGNLRATCDAGCPRDALWDAWRGGMQHGARAGSADTSMLP